MRMGTRLSGRPRFPSAAPHWLAALRAYLLTVAAADLLWETAHLPLYTLWQTGTTGKKLFAVVHCTAGDLLIALASLISGLIFAGHRDWPVRRFMVVAAFTLAFGFGYTVFSEWQNVAVRKSWAYSDLMPVVPILGFNLGVSPLLQWVVVPTLALWASRRVGATPMPHAKGGTIIGRQNFAESGKERT